MSSNYYLANVKEFYSYLIKQTIWRTSLLIVKPFNVIFLCCSSYENHKSLNIHVRELFKTIMTSDINISRKLINDFVFSIFIIYIVKPTRFEKKTVSFI